MALYSSFMFCGLPVPRDNSESLSGIEAI